MTQHLADHERPSHRGREPAPRVAASSSRDERRPSSAPSIAPAPVSLTREGPLDAFVRDFAPLDWLVITYFTTMFFAILFGSGPEREHSMAVVALDLGILLSGLLLSRSGLLGRHSFVRALIYRFTIFGVVSSSYFQLRHILPAVSSRAVDASIFAFDQNVFHYEPSLAWDRFVTPETTEWFAFFYFGYFFILAAHILPFLLVVKNHDLAQRFAFGIFTVFVVGHLTYMLVPGYGPYRFLAGQFQHELSGGTYWGLVKEAVYLGGAQKDIFPSLHTAVPTYFAITSFRYRKVFLPFRYTWPIVAFAATQIIIATMFLRWHYLVDIFAGLTLASGAVYVSGKIAPWETRRREVAGLLPAWRPLDLPRFAFLRRRAARDSNAG